MVYLYCKICAIMKIYDNTAFLNRNFTGLDQHNAMGVTFLSHLVKFYHTGEKQCIQKG